MVLTELLGVVGGEPAKTTTAAQLMTKLMASDCRKILTTPAMMTPKAHHQE